MSFSRFHLERPNGKEFPHFGPFDVHKLVLFTYIRLFLYQKLELVLWKHFPHDQSSVEVDVNAERHVIIATIFF